ncbi:VP1 [Scorpion polyomavirus 3]|nr:VP1 [Scorpion polyomavirus 3]
MSDYTEGPIAWSTYSNRMCRYEILKPDTNPCHRIYALTYIACGGDQILRVKQLIIQHPDEYWCSPSNSCNKPKKFTGTKCSETTNKILRWEIFAVNVEQRWINPVGQALNQPYYNTWAIGNSELVLVNYHQDVTKRAQIQSFAIENRPGDYDWSHPENQSFYIFAQNQYSTETIYPSLNQNAFISGETSRTNNYTIITDEDKIGIILFKPVITLGHAFYVGGPSEHPGLNVKFKLYLRPRNICVQPLLSHILANQGTPDDIPPIPHFDHRVPTERGLKPAVLPTPTKPAAPCITTCQPNTVRLTESSLQTTIPPEKEDETPSQEVHEKMEVDPSKQRNVLQLIEETTQSDTVPRPISPSEVPNGPAVDPIDEVRGDRDGEDDTDGLLTFENIHFAYNIYIDMFKEPDSLETFTNYLRRNAKLDRVAEKMVEKYKNKKKSK